MATKIPEAEYVYATLVYPTEARVQERKALGWEVESDQTTNGCRVVVLKRLRRKAEDQKTRGNMGL